MTRTNEGYLEKKDVTPEFLAILAQYTLPINQSVLTDLQSKLLAFIQNHPNDRIDFYKARLNIFSIFANKPDLLLNCVLMHSSMTSRSDHGNHRHAMKIFKAMARISADIFYKNENQKLPKKVRVSGLWKEAVNDFIPSHSMDLPGEIAEKQQSLQFLKVFCRNYVCEKSVAVDCSQFFSALPVDAAAAFDAYFQDYPQREIWRLFYDVDKQKNVNTQGWANHEIKDPGFFEGMARAFIFLKQTISQPLTVDLFEQLHIVCTATMQKKDPSKIGPIRTSNVRFGIVYDGNTSLPGLMEFLDSKHYGNKYFLIQHDAHHYGMGCPADANMKIDLQNLFEEYRNQIGDASISPNKRMHLIVNLVGELIRIHPFMDGNCRTICTLLLMRELMRNGFPPAMLDDPNRMMGYGREECVAEIVDGITHFNLIKTLAKRGIWSSIAFGKNTDEIIRSLLEKPELISHKIKWEAMLRLFQENGIGVDLQIAPSPKTGPGF